MNPLSALQVVAIGPRDVGRAQGRGLVAARAGWGGLAALIVGLFILGIGVAAQRLQQVCAVAPCDPQELTPQKLQALQSTGLSAAQYVGYLLALEAVLALAYAGAAALLVWRRATDRMALFAAFTPLMFGPATFGA